MSAIDRSGQYYDLNLVCPFMMNHVMSGEGTNFTSTCDYITPDCVYSEENWDGGLYTIICIQDKCMLWDPETEDCVLFTGNKAIPTKPEGSTYELNTVVDMLIDISEKIRSEDMPEPLYSVIELLKHVHDSHEHVCAHPVDEIPSCEGAPVLSETAFPSAAVLANEWLNQQDLNGDGKIYGPALSGEPPVLRSLKNHPDWDQSWEE